LKKAKPKPTQKTQKAKPKAPVRVAQGIDEVGGLLTEQCRLYRAARRREITPDAGYKLMRMLAEIRTTIVANDHEARIRALEQPGANQ